MLLGARKSADMAKLMSVTRWVSGSTSTDSGFKSLWITRLEWSFATVWASSTQTGTNSWCVCGVGQTQSTGVRGAARLRVQPASGTEPRAHKSIHHGRPPPPFPTPTHDDMLAG